MLFPQKLQEYRRTRKLSQEELANQLGVSRQSVSKWEQGLSFPETDKLIELSTMMGASIDSLLKDEAEVQAPLQTPAAKQIRLKILISVLLIVIILALALVIWLSRGTPTPPDTTPVVAGPVIENKDLGALQGWFFDFAREYRLDYMPQFTHEDGAPTDAGKYLYWAFAINLDNWGEDKGKMAKSYVEETVLQYFAVIPGQHRSHRKSWDYDAKTETYIAYPESIGELGYYLLNSIEIDRNCYTVHATRYYSPYYMLPEDEEKRLQESLLDGGNYDLTAVSEVMITFSLDSVFHKPVFYAFTERPLTSILP